jgi:hypothetical protein
MLTFALKMLTDLGLERVELYFNALYTPPRLDI